MSKRRLGIIFLILAAAFLISPWGRAGIGAGMFLLQIIPGNKFKPLEILTGEPTVAEVTIVSQGRTIRADVWKPKANRRYPAAIVAYGTDVPKDQSELAALAKSLASMGSVVLVPNVPELLQTRYVANEVEDFVNLFLYLKNQPYVDVEKIGYVSFCIGSSLSLLAAEDERIANDVDFILVKSVYVDTYAITRDTVTRTLNDAPVANFWQPQEKLRQVVIVEMTDFIGDADDRELARQSLLNRKSLSEVQAALLASDAQAIYQYLANTDPVKSRELWEKIPEPVLAKIDKVSPIVNMDKLKAKVFIMAATSDIYLPYTESLKLYNLLPKDQVEIEEVGFLNESGLNPMVSRRELLEQGWKLYRYFYKAFLPIYSQ